MNIGWNMVVETTNGVVGLWTCWLGNNFKLYYPLDVEIPDEMVMETLGVKYAKPVADEQFGTRLWAKYYSRKLKEGRVWVDQSNHDSYGHGLCTIAGQRLVEHYCGHSETNTITTFDFTFCSEKQPDAPTTDPKVIQQYKKKFVELLLKVAKHMGDIKAVTFDSGLELYTPELLEKEGYKVSRWREDYTNYCYANDDNFEFILKSGNSLVEWITYIRFRANNELTADDLFKFMKQLKNTTINLKPLFIDMLQKAIEYQDYATT